MIEPSIGRIVWYFADHAATKGMKSTHPEEPFAAIVTAIHTDRLVNLLVFDHQGTTFAMQSVPLFQGDEDDDETAIAHCEWMPYQRRQAERTRAVERPAGFFPGANIHGLGPDTANGPNPDYVPPPKAPEFWPNAPARFQPEPSDPLGPSEGLDQAKEDVPVLAPVGEPELEQPANGETDLEETEQSVG